MKKPVLKYFLFSAILMILIFALPIKKINDAVYKIMIEAKKNTITSKANMIKSNLSSPELINFRNYYNLEYVRYIENNIIKSSSMITEVNQYYSYIELPEEKREEFWKSGYWFKDKEKYIYYTPVEKKGILVLEVLDFNEKNISKETVVYIMKVILYTAGILVLTIFIYFLYNFYVPCFLLLKYIRKIKNPLETAVYDKKINADGKGDFGFIISEFNKFIDIIKEKIFMIEEDRKAIKKVYETMKVKNSQVMSLYEFAKTLSFNLEIEKIYEKIKEIIFYFMESKVLLLAIKIENEKPEIVICEGIESYKNDIKENSIEEIAEKYGKPIKVRDSKTDKRVDFKEMTEEDKEKLTEFIIVPLRFENKNIGFMIVDKIFENKLKHADEVSTLTTIGEIIARAITKAQKYREMNIGLNLTSVLYQITSLVESNKDMYEIFKEIIRSVKKIIDYTSGAIYLLNEKNELDEIPVYREGEKNEILETVEFKLGKGIKALVAQNKDAVIIKDVRRSAKGLNEIFNEKEEKIASFISVPMIVKEKLVGVMNLTHKEPNKFDEEDKKVLKLFSAQAAATIEKIKKDRQIEELLAKVTNESITDALTGMYNRRYMMKRMEEELERSRRQQNYMGLLGIDIDHFKRFNDTYGHQTGDLVLKEVAAAIKNSIRVIDIPCRYGGEEFFVILPNTNPEGINITAERIRKSVEERVLRYNNQILGVTVSIGTAAWPKDAGSIEDIIKRADEALYIAKNKGRNRVINYGQQY